MRQRLKTIWVSLTIRQKIQFFTGIDFSVIILSILLAVWAIKYFLLDFSVILKSNAAASDFVQCMENEAALFEIYIKSGNADDQSALVKAMKDTREVVGQLPFDYARTGAVRYAGTWSVFNMYEVYCQRRDQVLGVREKTAEYITVLYEVYEMQEYLQSYAVRLMRDTLADGVVVYEKKVRTVTVIPVMIILFELLFFMCIRRLSDMMNQSIVSPVMELAESSRRIAENDFYIDDIKVQSSDELGELVHAFNKMKYATGEYITALEERRRAMDLYHAEEMEKLKVAARLDAMELEVLKSQVNPHFLFNTLNVIGGMADLEGAHTTEKMIQALGSLFRYNLKTPEEKVPLARELKVTSDYMFLQMMRFGSRISYDIDCQADAELVEVPAFIFQPLVENAIIHGLAPQEEDGHILIRIRQRRGMIHISIADNGMGIEPEKLRLLRKALQEDEEGRTSQMGIGLFNIYKRIHTICENGQMQIYSRRGTGTIISIFIADERGANDGEGSMPHSDCG